MISKGPTKRCGRSLRDLCFQQGAHLNSTVDNIICDSSQSTGILHESQSEETKQQPHICIKDTWGKHVEDVASVATVSIHQQTLQIEFRMKDVNENRVQHITSISGVSHSFFPEAWEFSCRKRNKQIREKSWDIFGLSAPPHFGSLLFKRMEFGFKTEGIMRRCWCPRNVKAFMCTDCICTKVYSI